MSGVSIGDAVSVVAISTGLTTLPQVILVLAADNRVKVIEAEYRTNVVVADQCNHVVAADG